MVDLALQRLGRVGMIVLVGGYSLGSFFGLPSLSKLLGTLDLEL